MMGREIPYPDLLFCEFSGHSPWLPSATVDAMSENRKNCDVTSSILNKNKNPHINLNYTSKEFAMLIHHIVVQKDFTLSHHGPTFHEIRKES